MQAQDDSSARLRTVQREYGAWEARISQPREEPFSAGNWMSSGPGEPAQFGILVRVSNPARFREIAAALIAAADEIEGSQ